MKRSVIWDESDLPWNVPPPTPSTVSFSDALRLRDFVATSARIVRKALAADLKSRIPDGTATDPLLMAIQRPLRTRKDQRRPIVNVSLLDYGRHIVVDTAMQAPRTRLVIDLQIDETTDDYQEGVNRPKVLRSHFECTAVDLVTVGPKAWLDRAKRPTKNAVALETLLPLVKPHVASLIDRASFQARLGIGHMPTFAVRRPPVWAS